MSRSRSLLSPLTVVNDLVHSLKVRLHWPKAKAKKKIFALDMAIGLCELARKIVILYLKETLSLSSAGIQTNDCPKKITMMLHNPVFGIDINPVLEFYATEHVSVV